MSSDVANTFSAQKAGTSSLCYHLAQHKQIVKQPYKEVYFFNNHNNYLSAVTNNTTANYFEFAETANRIRNYLWNPK